MNDTSAKYFTTLLLTNLWTVVAICDVFVYYMFEHLLSIKAVFAFVYIQFQIEK
jgi:hypothetical protein